MRPFYWSVRRELWENPALYLAPIAVAGVVLLGFLLGSWTLPGAVVKAAAHEGKGQGFMTPYSMAAGAAFMITFFVGIFYALGALNNERRDRSILFWKSLPVSDLTTVLSKAAIPLVVQPVIIIVVAIGTQLLMLVWSTIVLLLNGIDPGLLWSRLDLGTMWVMLPYGLLINAFWDLPFYGWLLLVSVWAKRMTFVWAFAPPLVLCAFEYMVFHSRHLLDLLGSRVFGGYALAYTVGGDGKTTISDLSQMDPLRILALPGLWGGIVVGVACLAACVWLRRRREPI